MLEYFFADNNNNNTRHGLGKDDTSLNSFVQYTLASICARYSEHYRNHERGENYQPFLSSPKYKTPHLCGLQDIHVV
jgi:hypothetical protein